MVKVPPEKAFSFFISSTCQGLQHTSQSVSFILNRLLSSGMQSQAQSILARVISGQIASAMFSASSLMEELTQTHFTSYSTHALLYEAIVNAYGFCEAGDLVKSFQLLAMMEETGFSPNVVIYTTLIDGCCKNGDVHLGKKLFSKMEGLD
ncbi:pentatricopeptide repeat-containing protein, partial [Trifolium medium]|nr:pentatricopeptide repeat-containing protein [Trifolium medium]